MKSVASSWDDDDGTRVDAYRLVGSFYYVKASFLRLPRIKWAKVIDILLVISKMMPSEQ